MGGSDGSGGGGNDDDDDDNNSNALNMVIGSRNGWQDSKMNADNRPTQVMHCVMYTENTDVRFKLGLRA